MKKTYWIRTAAAVGTVLTLSVGYGAVNSGSSAAKLCKETEMAGISLSLDKYYQDTIVEDEAVGIKIASGSAVETELNETEPTQAPAQVQQQQPAQQQPVQQQPAPTPAVAKQFQTTALSIASDYVNIRKSPSTNAKILGKLYEGSSCKILEEKDGWTKIESGSVTGYIKSEYLAKGAEAEKLATKYGTYYANVIPGTITLNVRTKPNTNCTILTQIPEDEYYEVLSIGKYWVKISIDGDKGYVAKEFVRLHAKFKKAISIEEEEAEARRKAAAAAAEQERLAALAAEQERNSSSNSGSSGSNSGNSSRNTSQRSSGSSHRSSGSSNSSSKKSSGSSHKSSGSSHKSGGSSHKSSSPSVSSGSGSAIAAYAQNFVGNPYVYGGTSLTSGADCSGFTMSVYMQFGYSLPHSSAAQAGCGKSVSLSAVQPGDLIFYKNGGSIGHVALYIGGGQVVHASNPTDGIKISSMRYRTPACARRIIG